MSRELRALLEAGQPAFGAWAGLGSPIGAEVLAGLGFDYVTVDLQHGWADLASAAELLQAVSAGGATPLARVVANEPWIIGRVLDLGAAGVIVPLVSSVADAERAAAACRYPPAGGRSFGPVRNRMASGSTTTVRNARVLCIVMVETREAVDELESICAVSGVDGVYIGPTDLGLSCGLEPGPELDEVIAHVRDTCRRLRVPAGMHAHSAAAGRAFVEAGFAFATVVSDRELLGRAAHDELRLALGREPEQGAPDPLRSPPPRQG